MGLRSLLTASLLGASLAASAAADSIDNVGLSWGGNANVINLFSTTGEFGPATGISEPGWFVSYGANGQFLQLRSLDGSVSGVIGWLQNFQSALGSPTMDFAWQSTIWDYSTNSPGAIAFGTRTASSSSLFTSDAGGGLANYLANGGPAGGAFVAPVPEPSTGLIGAMGLGVLAWRRRMRAAPAAA